MNFGLIETNKQLGLPCDNHVLAYCKTVNGSFSCLPHLRCKLVPALTPYLDYF